MRNAFVRTLTELAEKDERVVLLAGDLGYKLFDDFEKKFPKRFYNVGIAEANMVGMAAGLAKSGLKPYVYSIVPFVTLRCCEQIRNDAAYNNLDVKIIGVGAGYSYGLNGATHHGVEDIAIMRAIPNLNVLCPGDPFEVVSVVRAAHNTSAPTYIRLGRAGDPKIHKDVPFFEIGKSIRLSEQQQHHTNELTILVCGNILPVATEVSELLKREFIKSSIISMPSVKPLDKDTLRRVLDETESIVTLEEHNVCGGFGSAVAEFLIEQGPPLNFKSFGIEDEFIHIAGDQDYLRAQAGLSSGVIASKIVKFLGYEK